MLFRVDGAMAAICTLVLGRVKWDDRAELLNRGAAYGKCFAPPQDMIPVNDMKSTDAHFTIT